MPRLGVIVSQFPELHETFIVQEVQALRAAGVPLRIYSLKACRDRIVHPEARPLMADTTYLPWASARVWGRALGQALRHPGRAAATLAWTLRHHAWPPPTLAKALIVWMQALALTWRMPRDGVTHVHAHWATMPTTAAVVVSRWLGWPFSFTAHAWDLFVRNPSLKAKVELAARVFTCTEYNRRYLSHWRPQVRDKILCVYHGVDLERFRGPSPAQRLASPERLFLTVGRLVETKGYDVLLEAYRRLRDRGIAFRAVLVGEGPLRGAIGRRIARAGLGAQVELLPTRERAALRELYARAFAFVLPCVIARDGDRDGIPNVILEAMAMGLPVVSTTVSGVPEAVQDARTGLLVPPGDAERLSAALEQLVRRPNIAGVLGDHGRMWACAQFDAAEHLRGFVREMRRLLEGASPRVAPHPARIRPRPARVLYVIWSLEMGGAERIVESLAAGIDRRRFTPVVACLNHPGRLAASLRQRGVRVIALHKGPGVDWRALRRLATLMRRLRIDVVHAHLWGGNLWGRLAGRLCGVRAIVIQEHGLQPWRGRLHWWLDRRLLGLADRVLFVSERAMRDYRSRTGASAARCVLIPNGIEWDARGLDRASARRQLGWEPDERVIVSIGRLVPEKGHEDLLKALGLLRRQGEAVRVVLIGDGPHRPALMHLQARQGLDGSVVFAGTQDDVAPWLVGADAYVQPSRREALPLALLEAMAAGVPVIATRVGEVERLIRHGREGFLVPPADPAALAGTLLEVLRIPEQARHVAARAQQLVQSQYSRARMLDSVQALYDELLAGHPGGRQRR
jgi:glycosyltransferase involved in cell wall biosynthesis